MSQTQVERLFIKDRTSLMTDQFRITSNITHSGATTADITANLERIDGPTGFGSLGTGMSEGSGTFTFPSTGKYLIYPFALLMLIIFGYSNYKRKLV